VITDLCNWCLWSHVGVFNVQFFYRAPISNGGYNREDKEFWFIASYTCFPKGTSFTISCLSESVGGTLTWKLSNGKQDTGPSATSWKLILVWCFKKWEALNTYMSWTITNQYLIKKQVMIMLWKGLQWPTSVTAKCTVMENSDFKTSIWFSTSW
jgi:hypothetical protein